MPGVDNEEGRGVGIEEPSVQSFEEQSEDHPQPLFADFGNQRERCSPKGDTEEESEASVISGDDAEGGTEKSVDELGDNDEDRRDADSCTNNCAEEGVEKFGGSSDDVEVRPASDTFDMGDFAQFLIDFQKLKILHEDFSGISDKGDRADLEGKPEGHNLGSQTELWNDSVEGPPAKGVAVPEEEGECSFILGMSEKQSEIVGNSSMIEAKSSDEEKKWFECPNCDLVFTSQKEVRVAQKTNSPVSLARPQQLFHA